MSKKPGKYAHVIDTLPRTFGEEPAQQEKIDAVKKQVVEDYRAEHNTTPPASYLAREWADLRTAKDKLEADLSTIETQISAFTQLMVDQYEVEGIDKLHLDTGEAPRVQYEPYFSVEDNDKFLEWCRANGYERKLSLPWQTRNAIGKEVLLAGEAQPDGLKVWSRPKIVRG